MKIADQLRAAKALIEDEKHWTRGVMRVETRTGTAYCAFGATQEIRCREDISDTSADDYLFAAANGSVLNLNDNEGHAAVMALYDRAITLAEYVTL